MFGGTFLRLEGTWVPGMLTNVVASPRICYKCTSRSEFQRLVRGVFRSRLFGAEVGELGARRYSSSERFSQQRRFIFLFFFSTCEVLEGFLYFSF